MDSTTMYWKILSRFSIHGNQFHRYADEKLNLRMSRVNARRWRKQHVSVKENSVLNRKLLRDIKKYSQSRFGSEEYWPWLATYTEIKGEFADGWMPYDYYRFKFINEVNIDAFSRLSGIKTFDFRLFDGHVIKPEAISLRKRIYLADGRVVSIEYLISKLRELNCELVIKPDDASGGKNIRFVHSESFTKDHIPVNGSSIIQKAVSQHQLLEKVNPSSINTFRVLSYIDENGNVDVKFVFLRYGVAGSRLDNISSGGGWVFIYPNGNADDYSYDLEGFEKERVHPETKVKFSTLSFPFYDRIVKLCIESHQKIPYSALIGWDVFINEQGNPKLIEWNAKNPFFWPVEARYGPFFEKDEL